MLIGNDNCLCNCEFHSYGKLWLVCPKCILPGSFVAFFKWCWKEERHGHVSIFSECIYEGWFWILIPGCIYLRLNSALTQARKFLAYQICQCGSRKSLLLASIQQNHGNALKQDLLKCYVFHVCGQPKYDCCYESRIPISVYICYHSGVAREVSDIIYWDRWERP